LPKPFFRPLLLLLLLQMTCSYCHSDKPQSHHIQTCQKFRTKYAVEIGAAALEADPQSILMAVLKHMVPFGDLISAVKAAWRLWDARNIMDAPTKTERSALIVKLCLDVAKDFVS
jgi:hypothetical protein